jgi:predicted DNA-binding transcriptional regulator YafY
MSRLKKIALLNKGLVKSKRLLSIHHNANRTEKEKKIIAFKTSFAEFVPVQKDHPTTIQYINYAAQEKILIKILYTDSSGKTEWKTIEPFRSISTTAAGDTLIRAYNELGLVRSYRYDRVHAIELDFEEFKNKQVPLIDEEEFNQIRIPDEVQQIDESQNIQLENPYEDQLGFLNEDKERA